MASVETQSNQLNLTVVALVALVAIVGLVALVLNTASVATVVSSQAQESAGQFTVPDSTVDGVQNTAGDLKKKPASQDGKA